MSEQGTDWVEQLPEPIREWDEVKNADSPDKFWDQVVNMRSRLGRSITIPGEDASEDARKEFLDKLKSNVPDLMPRPKLEDEDSYKETLRLLGYPEKEDEYTPPELEVPEGAELSEDKLNYFKKLAFEAGLTNKQFKTIIEKFVSDEIANAIAQQEQFDSAIQSLKQEWGAKFDENAQIAEVIRKQYFPFVPEIMSADTIKAFVNIAKEIGGESTSLAGVQQKSGMLTPEEAAFQLSEILNNKEHPYWNPRDPAHKAARKRVSQLTRMKVGSL